MASVTTTNTFSVEIDGVVLSTFTKISAMKQEVEKIEYKQSTSEGRMQIFYHPGAAKWEPVTLERWYDGSTAVYDWYKNKHDHFNPETDKVTCTIKGFDKQNQPTVQWDLTGCWPISYEGPEMAVDSNAIVSEKVTFAVENIEKIK
jgi:phage tail-like protein